MRFKKTDLYIISGNIIYLEFPCQYLMTATLLRMQERYESPFYKNKAFGLEEYMDYYAKMYGEFDYYTTYQGFNFPYKVLKAFFCGKFDPLTKKEKIIIDILKKHDTMKYVIGTYLDSTSKRDDFTHEYAHALYYTNKEYKKLINETIQENRTDLEPLFKYLRERMHYHKNTIIDETIAYILENSIRLQRTSTKQKVLNQMHIKFREIFNRFKNTKKEKVESFYLA